MYKRQDKACHHHLSKTMIGEVTGEALRYSESCACSCVAKYPTKVTKAIYWKYMETCFCLSTTGGRAGCVGEGRDLPPLGTATAAATTTALTHQLFDVNLLSRPVDSADCPAQLRGTAAAAASVSLYARAKGLAKAAPAQAESATKGSAKTALQALDVGGASADVSANMTARVAELPAPEAAGSFVGKSNDVSGEVQSWTEWTASGAMTWDAMKATCTAKGHDLCCLLYTSPSPRD